MLYFAVVFTTILLALALYAARPAPERVRWMPFVATGFVLSVFPVCLVFPSPAVFFSFIGLGAALALWAVWRQRIKRFWPLGLATVTLVYLAVFGYTFLAGARDARLRAEYPVESMVERLPEPTGDRHALRPVALANLEVIEREIAAKDDRGRMRTEALKRLHYERVQHFVDSPGFGVTRSVPTTYFLRTPPRSPTPSQSTEWPTTDHGMVPTQTPSRDSSSILNDLHRGGLLDFLNLDGFGYVKDRTRVAGFQPHGFSWRPEAKSKWTVDRIELVSLLIHREPAVYVTDRLPSMEKVRDVPTRPLDEFEAASLKLLRTGEDMTSAAGPEVTRAFGSIRSAKQCVECHGGLRGDLLGAFSYTLRDEAAKKP